MERLLRKVVWVSEEEPGIEHVALRKGREGYRVDGDFTGLVGGEPVRARYRPVDLLG